MSADVAAVWAHPDRVYSEQADGWPPHGAVVVRFSNSHDPEPYYLQGVIRGVGYYGTHLIENERFAAVEQAVARAKELSRV